jgi:hypothetical protein
MVYNRSQKNMTTKRLFSMLLLVATVATSAFGQPPKREVVFTLNANEVIYENEYALFQTLHQNRFACMTRDTITDEYTFVFNGERIKVGEVYYVNPGETKGYVFTYWKNDRGYINYRGVVDGGFEGIHYEDPFTAGRLYTSEKDYDYLYELAGRWYASKNGEKKRVNVIERAYGGNGYDVKVNGKTIGGFYGYGDGGGFALTKDGKYAYWYRANGNYHVNINGSIVGGPYEYARDLIFTESGKYAYAYRANGKYYVNVNGSTVGGPYDDSVYHVTLSESGKYAYFYAEKGWEYYVNVNDSTVAGPYRHDGTIDIDLTLTESGKYAYCFCDNKKRYVNVNGSIVGGPYEHGIDGLTLTESGKYAYCYRDNTQYYEWYMNVNGSTIGGPYTYVSGITLTEDGKYGYRFNKNRKHYINTNGVVTEDRAYLIFDNDYYDDALDLTTKDGEHSFYSSYEYDYVVIDGRPHGKSPAIEAWYDEPKNAFVWSAVEGRELVVYEYTLK